MRCIIIAIIYCFLTVPVDAIKDNKFNFTYAMAMRCKEHICHGYGYDVFYEVNSLDRQKTKDKNVVFEMHLAIQAPSNGLILLSTTPTPTANDPVYEIVVGGGANKFTELRRNLRRNARASAGTPNILSFLHLRAFYIRIGIDGTIEFGKEGDDLPLISYTDHDPLDIMYFSFASWNGVEAKFLYDCPAPGDNSASPDSVEVEPTLSGAQQVRKAKLMDRSPTIPGRDGALTVSFGAKVLNVIYNAFESKLTTNLAIIVSWNDESMAWNPSKFNGTTSVTFRPGEIWRPTFFAFNGADMNVLDTRSPGPIYMLHSGLAVFQFRTTISSWCYDSESYNNKWPHDEYTCALVLGPYEAHEKITLEQIDVSDMKMKMFTAIDQVVENDWKFSVKSTVLPLTVWVQMYKAANNVTNQSDKFLLAVEMKRVGDSYNIVVYTPLLVLVTFVLLSFWSERLQMSRVWFYAGCAVVVCMGLCNVDYLVPWHSMPSILVLYITVLMGILVALLVQVILMTSTMSRLCKTMTMQNFLTAKCIRIMFCLPEMKTCTNYNSMNEGYDRDDEESELPTQPIVEEMQAEPKSTYGETIELAEVVDKVMFVIYTVVFAVMLALHY